MVDESKPKETTVGAIIASVSAGIVGDALAELQKRQVEMLASAAKKNWEGIYSNWTDIAAVSGAMATISGVMASPPVLSMPPSQFSPPIVEPPRPDNRTTVALQEKRITELEGELKRIEAALRKSGEKDTVIAKLSVMNRRNARRAAKAEKRASAAEVREEIAIKRNGWLQKAIDIMAAAFEEERTQIRFESRDE